MRIYADLLLYDSEAITVFIIASYPFKFFSYLTYTSIDHNFSYKKHTYLMSTSYSESCSEQKEASMKYRKKKSPLM